ncbi:hypothetical protein NDA16_000151 [Ustilago loliicola]|nr:hypothetical protein NDA16_000151 [Ustilago loliicola]
MAPALIERAMAVDLEGVEGSQGRTRVDDTDPDIIFTPGPPPYQNQQSPWVVVKDANAYNGSAVSSNRTDAKVSFNFSGDSLTLGMLYKASGTSIKLTLENGTSYPFTVSATEATASAPNGDKEALQKKAFRLDGLACTNHTATLAPAAVDGQQGAQPLVYFDWFSFSTPGNPATCKPSASASATRSSSSPGGSTSPSSGVVPVVHDHSMQYAGIGAGAAILGFILVLVTVTFYRRRQRLQAPAVDESDRTYRPKRSQRSEETLKMPLTMSQNGPAPALQQESVFRPRGLHALDHDASFSTVHSDKRNDVSESPSASTVFPLMPVSPGNHVLAEDDAGFGIGQALLELQHDPSSGPRRQLSQSLSKLHYETAQTLSSTPPLCVSPKRGPPALIGGYALQRVPKGETIVARPTTFGQGGSMRAPKATRASPRRPCTASAVDRLRSDARQLDVHRPLSPFNRSRPTTSAETRSHHCQRDTTSPAEAIGNSQRFRRNSSCSADTHFSRASAQKSAEVPAAHDDDHQIQQPQSQVPGKRLSKSLLDLPKTIEGEKSSDSEAEMWISKRKILAEFGGKRRRNSTIVPPRRPPKSPHRPSTGQAAPPALPFQSFTIS